MKTVYTSSASDAAVFLRSGGVVAFPTETVFGLGGDATKETSIKKIFKAKGRPADNPLIVHLHSVDQLDQVVRSVSSDAERLMEMFFPGPLSIILPKSNSISSLVTAGLDTVAVRIPGHPVSHSFLQACDVPVAAPSANQSGRPSPTTWQAVQEDLDGRIDAVLTSGEIEHGIESTVVDCSVAIPRLLRAGSLSLEALREVIPAILGPETDASSVSKSPGTKYRHYSPSAKVVLFAFPDDVPDPPLPGSAYLGLMEPSSGLGFKRVEVFEDSVRYARRLYELFRVCDREGIRHIYCQRVPNDGLGVALNDRLQRASQMLPEVG